MIEPRYGMTKVAELLGITRQGAYARMEKEKWSGCNDGGGKANLTVPSSAVKASRDLERQKLLERVDELDALNSLQIATNALLIAEEQLNK